MRGASNKAKAAAIEAAMNVDLWAFALFYFASMPDGPQKMNRCMEMMPYFRKKAGDEPHKEVNLTVNFGSGHG
jgi:hypothetical protein